MNRLSALATSLIFASTAAFADSHGHSHDHDDMARTPAPEGAMVYFIGLEDGATVSNPVTLLFGARGIGIAPAGIDWPNTGHHHLLINVDPAEVEME